MMLMKKNQGFSLIEVLVTIVLTTVGILGMVALQVKSISYTQDTIQREAAISAADELVEIMRTYRDELYENIPPSDLKAADVKGSYGEFYSQLKSSSTLYADEKAVFKKSDCPTTGTAQTVKAVAGCWLQKQERVLPDFKVERLCPSVSADDCTDNFKGSSLLLDVSWSSRDQSCGVGGDSATCHYSVRVEL